MHGGEGVALRRRIGAALAVLAAVVPALLLPIGVLGEESCPVEGQITTGPDGWTRILTPRLDTGPISIRAYAVDRISPNRLFVTDGSWVMRSDDGGCLWNIAYRAQDGSTVVSIVIPASPDAHDRVLLLLAEGTSRTHVVVSENGYGGWAAADAGLLPTGAPKELMVAGGDPSVAYLVTAGTSAPNPEADAGGDVLYASADGGRTWEVRPPAWVQNGDGGASAALRFNDVAVNPLASGQLWGTAAGGLYRSTDGGGGWEPVDVSIRSQPVPLGVIDLFHPGGGNARITAFALDEDAIYRSADGGSEWGVLPFPAPVPVESVSHSRAGDLVVALPASRRVLHSPNAGGSWALLRDTGALQGAVVDLTDRPAAFARTTDSLWRFDGLAGGTVPVPPTDPGSLSCSKVPPLEAPAVHVPEPSVLEPQGELIRLRPGERKTVTYSLEIDRIPSKMDVWFLIDTTQSMAPAICGLKHALQRIADELAATGHDLRFGLGDFQEYPIPPHWPPTPQQADDPQPYPYRLDRELGRPDPDLSFALSALEVRSNKGYPEAALPALYQSVTGEGQPPWIEAGRHARFRDDALKAIVNITDAAFNEGETYPGQRRGAVAGALHDAGVVQLGIAVKTPDYKEAPAEPDLVWMAERTKARVFAGPVVCNPDPRTGEPEMVLQRGDPAVCLVPSRGDPQGVDLTGPVADLLLSLRDDADVTLQEGLDPADNIDSIDPPDGFPNADLRHENRFPFQVTFTCGQEDVGLPLPVTLTAEVNGKPEGVPANAIVQCLGPPAPPVVAQVPPLFPPPIVVPPPPPPPVPVAPPQPIPQPLPQPQAQPQSNPQSQAQAQSQAQPQAGLVTQKQEQTQTAFARASEQVREEGYAMIARREPSRAARNLTLGGGALVLAFGCASLARARSRVARARRRH